MSFFPRGFHGRCGGRPWLAALLAAVAAWSPMTATAADDLELKVKAAFLFNFAKFISWPPAKAPQPSAPIVFCALERDAFADALEQSLQGKTIDAHELVVRRLPRAEDMRGCHVAYLGALEPARLGPALEALSGSGVLSVYEGDEPRHSGQVRFFLEDHRVHFEINTAAIEREHLEVSSRLLSVARIARE